MAIRFHLDERVPVAVAQGLRRHGVDASTSQETNLLGRDDDDQLKFAVSEERVLVTHDDDFTRIHSAGTQHCGICYCHQNKYSIGDLIRTLLLVYECFTEEEMRNYLEYL